MAGLGGAPAQQVQAGATAQPLVTSATPLSPTILNAFRDGFITADDIIARIGDTGKAKQKAELTMATEATSPEAIAARKQALLAQTAQAELAQRQAVASGPLVDPNAELQAKKIAAEQALLDPKRLIAERLHAFAEQQLKPANVVKQVDPASGAEFTRMLNADGLDVTPGSPAHTEWSKVAQSAFSELQPGAVQVITPKAAPAAPVAPAAVQPAPGVTATPVVEQSTKRAQLINSGQVTQAQALTMDDATVAATPIVQPAVTAPTIQPTAPTTGGYVPGQGIQTGMRSVKDRALVPAEGVEKLALASQAKSTADRLQKAYADLIESDPMFTGLLNGTITKAIAGKRWNEKVAAFEREATAILAPVAKGTYNETGVLSDKDVERYKNVLPDLRDTPAVGNEKMQRLINEVNSAYTNKIDMWKKAGYDISQLGTPSPAASTPPAASSTSKLVTIPGLGTGTYDSATGLFTRTQ